MKPEVLADVMHSLEISFFDNNIRHSQKKLDELIANDFMEYGRSGKIYYKNDIIPFLLNSEAPAVQIENLELKQLSKEIILLNYRSIRTRETGENDITLRSSIWRKFGTTWKIFFHQGTPS